VQPGIALEMARARLAGAYALRTYLPVSQLARSLRHRLRRLRGKASADVPVTRLAHAAWPQILKAGPIRLAETAKSDGNVRLSELAVLALAALATPAGSEIIEIGTFDGRTALKLAINAPHGVSIATLDLPADQPSALAIEESERRYIGKPVPGARLRSCGSPWRDDADRVVQLRGDSATFDWSPHFGRAGLVFVDGSHAYDYARKDSETAMRLVKPGGVVLWHDYGVWPGVTQALEELEAARRLGLVNIRGTSLVFWRAG
jgi:predicted O-methyltransferase YrrM